MFYRVRDCPYRVISLYNSKKTGIFKEPNRDLIRAELSALRPGDLPTAIKGHREWNKINDCYTLDLSPAVETYIEVEYQRRLSAKYFPEILCSLIVSTGATLELISAKDTEKVNKNKISHTIKNIEKKIKGEDAEAIFNAPDISPDEAETLKQNPIRSFTDNMTLQRHYLWKIYASDDIGDNGAGFETQEGIMAIKLNDPNYHPTVPILPPYKSESVNETQELFDSIPITTDISEEVKLRCSAPSISIQNQSNDSKQFSNIIEIKEIPESLISLSLECLIKNDSDIDTLIFYLQEKFQMSKEKLEQWRAKIAFEMRDNHNYWKKERESMNEADFLEYKRNFEAKIKVSTTPHKKELKSKSWLLSNILYIT
ncbi:2809_t:CDS:2 [Paraglomus occultum]|uniref:2809_t:CDS:1 n=1 Tax=Paraglomus occultum TaxID=144539 RepID=A0A9N9GMF1_9GLOM|nr:2809_t:CDS:2 [Paraglomus occultum]